MILLLLTTFTYHVILVNAFESVKTITVRITDDSSSGAPSMKATLWFDTAIYQFTIDKPRPNTEYSLSPTEFTNIGQSDCMDASDTKIMIERNGVNAVYIDWITFETYSRVWYGIDGYCADDQSAIDYYLDPSSSFGHWIQEVPECPLGYSHLQICVDKDMNECGPAKHIYYFDTSKPNQSILTAEAMSGMNTVVQIETCSPSNGPTASPITTHDPSKGLTVSPTVPSSSPTDNPFAKHSPSPTLKQIRIHAMSPTQPIADTTNTNDGSTDNVSSETKDALRIVMWVGGICVLWIGASVLCFILWPCRVRKSTEVQHDVNGGATADEMMACEDMIGTECIVPSCITDGDDDEILEVVNTTIAGIQVQEDQREGDTSGDEILEIFTKTIGDMQVHEDQNDDDNEDEIFTQTIGMIEVQEHHGEGDTSDDEIYISQHTSGVMELERDKPNNVGHVRCESEDMHLNDQ